MNRFARCLRPGVIQQIKPAVNQFRPLIFRQINTATPLSRSTLPSLSKYFTRSFHQGRYLSSTEKKTDTEAESKEETKTDTETEEPKSEAEVFAEKEAAYKATIEEKDTAIKEANDRLLRTLADMENLRTRSQKEVDNAKKYSAGQVAKDLLEVSDNLTLALDAAREDADDSNPKLKSFFEGVEMTEKTLLKCFGKHSIVRIDAIGKKFDPNIHDCLFEYQDPSARPGTVGQVVKAGYMIKDRLLRPASVGAVKGTYTPTEEELKEAEGKKK